MSLCRKVKASQSLESQDQKSKARKSRLEYPGLKVKTRERRPESQAQIELRPKNQDQKVSAREFKAKKPRTENQDQRVKTRESRQVSQGKRIKAKVTRPKS